MGMGSAEDDGEDLEAEVQVTLGERPARACGLNGLGGGGDVRMLAERCGHGVLEEEPGILPHSRCRRNEARGDKEAGSGRKAAPRRMFTMLVTDRTFFGLGVLLRVVWERIRSSSLSDG